MVKRKINQFSTFIKQPTSYKLFSILTIIVTIIALITLIFCKLWDTDSLWEIAEGREILENGIPYVDVFRIMPDMSVVVQQWLYDVIIALFDSLNTFGHILLKTINLVIVFGVGYLYLSQYKIKFEYKIIAITLLLIITQYPVAERPEGITLSLLILECYAFERYKKTKKWKWLLILPIGMLFEANFHMSMMWIHFLVALAYLLPSFFHKFYHTYTRSWKLPFVFSLSMIPVMFINPYGINGVLYTPISYLCGTFNYISIYEMRYSTHEVVFILIIFALMFFPTYFKKNNLFSNQVYLFVGALILMILSRKNVMFMYPALLCMSTTFLRRLTFKNIQPKIWVIGTLIISGVLLSVRAGQAIAVTAKDDYSTDKSTAQTVIRQTNSYGDSLVEADTYIRTKNNIENIKLFTGFNTGGFFEYMGYKNIYMDARPELRMKAFNKQRNELIDYQYYVHNKDYTEVEDFTDEYIKEVQDWIDEYNFDYIYIQNDMEVTLAVYMENFDQDYTLIDADDWGEFYERNI